jgi:outer membrane receptor for ferrienterochelin and colicins
MKSYCLVVFLLLQAMPAGAQTLPDLARTDIEELMRIEVQRVFGASERLQPVTEAPSSVTIVTASEIERHGYRTLADILRSLRGFYVSNDRNYSYVGARGFARPGDYNTRILLLLNGHRVNDDVYDQAAIGADFGVDVAMFDRVEVIRGPASSLYGANAFFAVINVITRSGASLNGILVDADAGTLGTGMARVSGGRRFSNGVDVAVSGTLERSDGDKQLYFPAFDTAATNHGVADHLDGERIGDVFGRLTAGDFAFTAAFGRRQKYIPTASFGTIFNEQVAPERTTDRHSTITGEYGRTLAGVRLVLDAGFDQYEYQGVYPLPSDNDAYPMLLNLDASQGIRWNAAVKLSRALPGRQILTAGAIFYDNIRQNQWYSYSDPSVESANLDHSSRQGGAYIQDEIRVRPWLLLTGGVRYDQYQQFRRTTPRGAVIVSPSSSTSFKYLYGQAFRAPNTYELHYYGTTPPDLQPESVDTHEVVWEQYLGEWLRTSASAYHYSASQLITFQALESDTVQGRFGFVNDGVIDANGVELEAEVKTRRGLQAVTSYTLQRAQMAGTDVQLTNSPRHAAKARVTLPFRPRAFASAEWQFIGERSTLAGATVGAASVVHLTAAWPIAPSLVLTGSIKNLFDQRYSDPASDEHLPDSLQQTGRTLRVGFRWTIRAR